MPHKKPIATLGSRYLWRSQWYNLRQDEARLPDGSDTTYTLVEHPGAVWIVPLTTDGQIVLIYNYRYAVGDWCWEVPAGGLRPGVEPEAMARRELLEEIGGQAEHWQHIARFYTMNGIGDEVAHVFLATGVTLGKPQHEPTEIMEIHLFSPQEALGMARRGEMTDGPSALSLLLCAEHLLD
jgi:ADP-ribose pyrophosphatase